MTAPPVPADRPAVLPRVLVLDADMESVLAVVRSLAAHGLAVDVAAHEASPLAAKSRHVAHCWRYPDPLTEVESFLNWLEGHLAQHCYQLVIPVTERTLVPLAQSGGRFAGGRCALPPLAGLEQVLDKDRTVALAETLDLAVPHSRLVTELDQLPAALEALGLPLVVKPARSIGEKSDARVRLSVDYAFSDTEARRKVQSMLRFGDVLLQEYFPGQGVGIELIADHGEVEYAFQHLRLHEVPLTGGGSSFRCSVPVEPELLDASRALMRALAWHGVAMVEFKWQPQTRDYRLMEINGRLWGSLPLAVAAGADFPWLLYRLMVHGEVPALPAARDGVYCRKLSADLHWLELVLRKAAPPQLVQLPGWRQVLRDLLRMLSPQHHFDVQSWRDPWPGLVDLWRIGGSYAGRVKGILHGRRLLLRERLAWRSGRVARQLAQARRLLFVCYGNINRSALAEQYFRQGGERTDVTAASAGFHPQHGRPADPVMQQIAAERGIDLGGCASQTVDRAMLEAADVIFVMDRGQLEQIRTLFPDAYPRTHLLGMAAGDAAEIADPYGREPAVYARCLAQVTAAVDAVGALLPSARHAR